VPLAVLASNLSIPFTFSSGQPIRSADVNANFAAVQTAVNSKLDVSAAPFVSGTRLKLVGVRSPDGMAFGIPILIYDSMLGVYCQPQFADDRMLHCLPNSANTFPSYFADSACNVPLYF